MQTQCPHCKSLYRLSPETIEAFGGFVRCGNCDYKFNVHDQVQVERDYFELSSEDALDEEMPLRLHSMGGIDVDEITAPASGRVEPALEVKDDGLNIRFSADEFGQQKQVVNTPSSPKVEPRFESFDENEIADELTPASASLQPELHTGADDELETGTENVLFTAADVLENEETAVPQSVRAEAELDDFAFSQGFAETPPPDDQAEQAVPDSSTKLEASAAETDIEAEAEARILQEKDSEADASALDELERLLDIPDNNKLKLELSEADSDADVVAGEPRSSMGKTEPELSLDDFSWGEDSLEAPHGGKAAHIFDDDFSSLDDDQEAQQPDPLDAFTFNREFDDEVSDVEPQGEIHTLLNDEGDQQDHDAPGFVHRFASGLGHFMVFSFWLMLSVGLVYLLIGQIRDKVYPQIKTEPLVQDIRSRVCSFLPCAESRYDVDQYEIVVSRMDEVRDPGRQLHISVFLLNRSEHALVYPSLGITFKRLDGSTVGQRVIGPDEYTTSNNRVVIAGDGAGGVTKPLIKAQKLGKVLIRFDNPPANAVGFEARVVP